jgi:CRISPR-associated protein Cmr2
MNQYMLMFSLGPVQPFIEQARKTRDLWLGSYLLSKLMEAAMKNIKELGGEFVFPAHKEVESENANLPNKYIAIFSDPTTAQKAAKRSTEQINDLWNTIRNNVRDEIVQWYADTETREIWERQSNPDACFEIRWVVVEGDSLKYSEWLGRTEEALEARKRLHNFRQREEPGEKSTISGERQALCRSASKGEPDRQQVQAFWEILATCKGHPEKKPPLSAKEISRDGSERLDAIDTIKRFATRSGRIGERPFPSTSSIATASFVEGLLSTKVDQTSIRDWLTATNGPLRDIPVGSTGAIPNLSAKTEQENEILQRDGDCYFHGTFTPRRLEKDYGIDNTEEAERRASNGRRALENLLHAAGERGLRRPIPYYAILKMDGDQMGKLLSTAESQHEHVNISNALSDFTRNIAPDLIHHHYPGRLVYAGGDDVLAFAPLARNLPQGDEGQPGVIKTVISLADQLQKRYRERLRGIEEEKQQREVSASMSIAIAHHFTPLSAVLRVMRLAERQLAKKRYGRNALVVSVIRRSGAQTQVGCHWEYKKLGDSDAQPMKLFPRFYDLFEQDILSPKCVYILLEEAPALVGLEQDAQISEIRRVLFRQRNDSKKSELADEEVKNLATHLVYLAKAMNREHGFAEPSTKLEDDRPRYGLVEALSWLLVMVFLTRKEEE